MNAILKYPGAKWRIADWIISHFPPHHSYLEAFAGSLAVLMRKARSNIETVNDLDGEVVNLFECIQRDPEHLARLVYWTPYSRQVYEQVFTQPPATDPYERAAAMLVRCNMGYGIQVGLGMVGWRNDVQGRERAYEAKGWTKLPERIIETAERLRGVQIECRPAVEVIRRFNYDNVLIYADPPYVLGSRADQREQYRHEMTDQDHRDLLDVLLAHKGPAVISGYPSALYDDALHGWHRETIQGRTQSGARSQEVIWLNYEPQTQLNLLGQIGGGNHEDTYRQGKATNLRRCVLRRINIRPLPTRPQLSGR